MLASKREAQKWLTKWDAMHDRYVKERAELQSVNQRGCAMAHNHLTRKPPRTAF
jgi:hypothetical protein